MQQFISEPVQPEAGSFDPAAMSTGLASLPAAFTWRGRRYEIVEVLDHAKLTTPEGGTPCGETYLRGQRFTVKLDSGQTAVLDFHRQTRARRGLRSAKSRWYLYTID